MSVLEFDCRFAYPSGIALDLKFAVNSGVTALLGPSGAGKTTTLHLIAGLLTPREGSIVLGGRTLFDSRRGINLRPYLRRVGLVFQDYQLFPHYTVAGNLRYGLHRNAESAIDLARLIEILELGPLLERYPASLSGGERQRVALGRAIASNPAMLLLDEPVSALDETLKASVLDYLVRTLDEFSLPTLLVTHDVSLVKRFQAKVILIDRGQCSAAGDCSDFRSKE